MKNLPSNQPFEADVSMLRFATHYGAAQGRRYAI